VQTSFGGGGSVPSDVFVAKLNATGTAFVYSTYLGGSNDDVGNGIAVDGSGNAYVTGYTHGNFPVTAGAMQTTFGAGFVPYAGGYVGADAFVAKLNATGSALVYSTYLGGGGDDIGQGIAVDGSGNAYVTGSTTGSFPTTPDAYQTATGGAARLAFMAKVNPSGTALSYSTYLGGSTGASAFGIAMDSVGRLRHGHQWRLFPSRHGANDLRRPGNLRHVWRRLRGQVRIGRERDYADEQFLSLRGQYQRQWTGNSERAERHGMDGGE
jgi:hypothetical protein